MEESAGRDMTLCRWVLSLSSLKRLDILFARLGVLVSIPMIIASIFFLTSIVTLIVFGMILVSCVIYIVANKDFRIDSNLTESRIKVKTYATSFFLLYILSIIILHFRSNIYERPFIYYVLIIIMSGVIALECLSAERKHSGFILIQILLLGMNIGWSQLLIVPSLIGIDPWYHYGLTSRIIEGYHLPEGYSYSTLPMFHLIIAITSIVTTFPYKFATMISVSFGQIACNATFVFLMANHILKNHRVGLLASLLIIIANMHIRWSYWSIPNAFGGIFMLITVYLLLTRYNSLSRLVTTVLMILLMLTIIFTHVLVAACMVITLFIAYGSFYYRKYIISEEFESSMSLLIPIFFSLALFTWWSYGSATVNDFAQFVGNEFSLDFMLTSMNLESVITVPTYEMVFPIIGTYLFFCLAIIGILYMLSKKGNGLSFTLALISLTFILLPFLFYISGRTIFEYRWNYFAQIFLSIPLALTLFLIGISKSKKNGISHRFIFGSVVILSFLMIMSPIACDDNHIFAPTTGRVNYYTQSEMIGTEFFAKKTMGMLSSDTNYISNPSSSVFLHVYDFDDNLLHNLDYSINSGKFDHDGSVKIFRLNHILEFQRKGLLFPDVQLPMYISNLGFSRIYDNYAMSGYIG